MASKQRLSLVNNVRKSDRLPANDFDSVRQALESIWWRRPDLVHLELPLIH
jgi:hypothetical protein